MYHNKTSHSMCHRSKIAIYMQFLKNISVNSNSFKPFLSRKIQQKLIITIKTHTRNLEMSEPMMNTADQSLQQLIFQRTRRL